MEPKKVLSLLYLYFTLMNIFLAYLGMSLVLYYPQNLFNSQSSLIFWYNWIFLTLLSHFSFPNVSKMLYFSFIFIKLWKKNLWVFSLEEVFRCWRGVVWLVHVFIHCLKHFNIALNILTLPFLREFCHGLSCIAFH